MKPYLEIQHHCAVVLEQQTVRREEPLMMGSSRGKRKVPSSANIVFNRRMNYWGLFVLCNIMKQKNGFGHSASKHHFVFFIYWVSQFPLSEYPLIFFLFSLQLVLIFMISQYSDVLCLTCHKLSLTLSNKYGKKICHSTSFFSRKNFTFWVCIRIHCCTYVWARSKERRKDKKNPHQY